MNGARVTQLVLHCSESDRLFLYGFTHRRLDAEGLRTHLGAYRISNIIYRKEGVIGGFVGFLLTWRTESEITRAILENDLQIETDIAYINGF